MYHCHIHFYLVGEHSKVFEIIQEMPPLEHFTHSFSESAQPDGDLTAQADVILADLSGQNAEEALETLLAAKRDKTELLLLTERDQPLRLEDRFEAIKDVWLLPMTEEEVRFRFAKWQAACRTEKEFWETSHFLEVTINSIPNLIWYKDKDGVHEKVNDSFCKTVNKAKQQVEGQRHAYIWDVEYDDPACIESERVVMETKKTAVSDEVVKTGECTP